MARRKDRRTPIPIPVDHDGDLPILHDNSELGLDDADVEEAKRKGSKGVGAVVVHHMVTVLQVVLVVLLGAWAYVTYSKTDFFAAPNPDERSAIEPYAVEGQVLRIEYALSVYYSLNEKYPVVLTSLVDDGLLQESDITYPGGMDRYRYQRFGDGFKLIVAREEAPQPAADDDALIFEE